MFFSGIPLIIIIIICVVMLFSYLLRRISNQQVRFKSSQKIYFKLGLYGTFLLISMILVLLIPMKSDLTKNRHFNHQNIPNLQNMAYNGELTDHAKNFLVYQQEFPYQDDLLNIRSMISGNHWFRINVLAEEKREEDSIVEVFLYQTPSFFDEADITTDIEPYQIEMHANTLAITAKNNNLSYAYFKTEFPFSQFEENRQPMFEEELHAGEQLVYLRVPKNMKIYTNDEQTYFQYVQ